MSDTPALDRAARVIAENVYAAFCRQATMPAHPLVEAIRPQIGVGSPGAIIEAVNGVLSAWEERDPDIRGPRIASVNQIDGSVTLR